MGNRLRALLCAGLLLLPGLVQAERVITLAPHLAELACAAGACGQIVGIGRHTDFPPELTDRPQVGDAFAVNLEQVLALKPDLLLAWDGGTPVTIIERLRRLGLRVETIRVQTLDDIGLALLRIGALLGTEDSACAAEAAFRARLDGLRTRYRDATPLRVLYQLQADPVFTVNAQSPISEAMALCGGVNIFADLPQLAGVVSREAVLQADPQVIFFGRQDDTAGILRGWKGFDGLSAVRSGNVLPVDSDLLSRATPRMLDGIEALCEALAAARQR